MRSVFAFACCVALLAASLAGAAESSASPLGKKIDEFALKDTSGKEWTLAGLADRKALVVVFVGTECPVNNLYAPRLAELAKEYAAKGVQFLAVNSNTQDTPARVAEHAKKYDLSLPVCKDAANAVADRFGARRTPEAFVLDGKRTVVYRGRIDDQYGVGFSRPKPTRRDLAEALDEVLAGKPVTKAETEAPGCLIARVAKATGAATVTYTKQVSRLLQAHCQECHRPGQIGPMPLLTYDDAAAWAETIKEVVAEKRMPPWYADPKHGQFENDRQLSEGDRKALLAWVDGGCPKGDDKDQPPPRAFVDGWRVGQPDVVFTMPKAFTVPAKAEGGLPYQMFGVKTNFTEDRWIQAAEAKPGNKSVVHHIIAYVIMPGQRRQRSGDGIGDGFLVGYAPGDMPAVFPAGTAKKIPKGAMIAFQMHYTPNGTEQTDRSSVGLVFAKEPPQHEMRTRGIHNEDFEIPPGDAGRKVTSSSTFREDAVLYSFLPHMHLRGKSFEYRAVFPGGKQEVLLSVPRWDFNWQSNYRLAKPLPLPAGTRIECTAYFDNSDKNWNNPDPTKTVYWGDQTWEEMMIGFVDYSYTAKSGGK